MLTRFILKTEYGSHILNSDELSNWDEVICSYKRSDMDGVVRSFTSSFKFVNGAFDLLFYIYRKKGFNSVASIEVQTQTNRWEWETQFSSPLDFSTLLLENGELSINCLDNSITSIIKARKSTKYEFVVGNEISSFKSLWYDRMLMSENAVYKFTQGQSISDSKDLVVTFSDQELPWMGLVSNEVGVNGMVYFLDDQENEPDGYMIMAHKDVKVRFKWNCSYRTDKTRGGVSLSLIVQHSDYTETKHSLFYIAETNRVKIDVATVSDLPELNHNGNRYAVIDGTVWIEGYHSWEDTGKDEADFFTNKLSGAVELELNEKDVVRLVSKNADTFNKVTVRFSESIFEFDWNARGLECMVPLIKPIEAARRILEKMTEGKQRIGVTISDYDPRLANTYLMAAESLRGIPRAKFYTSFNEFCEWMSTVFGYVYFIGPIGVKKYKSIARFNRKVSNYYTLQPFYPHEVEPEQIYFDKITQRFFCSGDDYYSHWINDSKYFSTDDSPREDIIYQETSEDTWIYQNGFMIFDPNDYIEEDIDFGVHFVHRSELFKDKKKRIIKKLQNLKYSVDTSLIYSSIEIGYEKKDYEETNGRDEFNFAITYTTGCTISDKSLKLISKYRADSYGIEYAVRKRGKDSTDSTSDNDVFFMLCQEQDINSCVVYPDRTSEVTGVSNETVFNADFSPVACVKANAGYIGLQTKGMILCFTSSTGNSDVTINGEPLSSDISLDSELATCGVLEFETDDLTAPDDQELIEVYHDGIVYRGFLKEVDLKYSEEESVSYKLIVKDIE